MSDELAEAKQLIKTLQGQIENLQWMKNHDYKFLVEENQRAHKELDEVKKELDEVKSDNKKLTQQINDMASKLRDSNF